MKVKGNFPSTRLRRVRSSNWVRRLVTEHSLSANDLILPIFVRNGKNKIEPIKSMPGVNRYSIDKLSVIMNKAKKNRIPMVALFPYTPKIKKDNSDEILSAIKKLEESSEFYVERRMNASIKSLIAGKNIDDII